MDLVFGMEGHGGVQQAGLLPCPDSCRDRKGPGKESVFCNTPTEVTQVHFQGTDQDQVPSNSGIEKLLVGSYWRSGKQETTQETNPARRSEEGRGINGI